MLSLALSVPDLARRRRGTSTPPPVFPAFAFAYWEGQGQSNMTGFNNVADAPANLRVVNADMEALQPGGGWAPYALLDDGESQIVDGVTYTGRLDEAEIPSAAGGAGPLIGLHEALVNGEMSDGNGFLGAALLSAKFSDAGKPLTAFLPDYDDGSAPLGGANYNARAAALPGALRARLNAGETIFAQGKIWLQGETDAGAARTAGSLTAPEITTYAANLSALRAQERVQLGTPNLPWHLVAIAETDAYDAALNAELESLCRWRVGPGGVITDRGMGDATSYFIAHAIDTAGAVHFNMTQIREIGALVFAAHQHHVAAAHGLSQGHQITEIAPVHQRPPAVTSFGVHEISVDAVVNEDGTLHGLIQPAGGAAPTAAQVITMGQASANASRGFAETLTFIGLNADTTYDVWLAYETADGGVAAPQRLTATTDEAPVQNGWTPATAGVGFWWDAQDAASISETGGVVTAWGDKSANAVALAPTGTGPVVNAAGISGQPAIDFDGNTELEGALPAGALSGDMCLGIVADIGTVTNGSEALFDLQTQNLKIRANNSAEFRARYELQNGANTNINPAGNLNYAGTPHIFVARYVAAAQSIEVWIDGVLLGTGSTYSIALGGADSIRLMRPWGSGLQLEGRIGEVVGLSSSAAADRERLEGYAAHRWGLTGLLPADHPYKTTAP